MIVLRWILPVRQGENCVDNVRIELRAAVPLQLCPRLGKRHRCAVRACRRHRVERVAAADDARDDRDRVADEAVRVPTAVSAFVAGSHDLPHLGEQPSYLGEEPLAFDRVHVDDRSLLCG